MAIKLTINKMKSEQSGIEEQRRSEEEIDKLKGDEKIRFEISVLKSRMFNVEGDIKRFGSNLIFKHKLELLQNQIKLLEEKLNYEKKEDVPNGI